ncbi:hypothetical protein [Mesorhizobium sp. B2-3-4]|uniref:hypothetical protein n=1 Tax=Mesorhizobium sp. B2-3-4 TaxID=2589959 RepID=UPI00112A9D3B|nr:hypothetical protein [Mesorhizobium sp. B2-3-4]TPM41430.1 hypothetical protein FJ967_00385 [Mesorhizobium sp. B2-3-4]
MASGQTNVEIIDEVSMQYKHGGRLCLQAARYHHPDGTTEDGFRFCWREANGNLKVLRGQTRLPNLRAAYVLMAMAADRPAFLNHRGADAADLPGSVNL